MQTAPIIPSPATYQPAFEPPLAPALVVMACGKHDRGSLFPKARRQLENLKAALRKSLGDFDGKNSVVFHDGSPQAEATVALMGFAYESNQGERTFFFSPERNGPDEWDLNKGFELLVKTDTERTVFFVVDRKYAERFVPFYRTRLGKPVERVRFGEGDAVVFETDGTLHVLSPGD
jgi:hypothetical protein